MIFRGIVILMIFSTLCSTIIFRMIILIFMSCVNFTVGKHTFCGNLMKLLE